MTRLKNIFRNFARNENGVSAVEFGVVIPVFVIILTYCVELGFSIYQATRVYDASEAGLLYASQNGFDTTGISNAILNSSSFPGITASPAPTQFCACPSASALTTAASCTAVCSNGSAPGQYIKVNATLTRQSIIPVVGLNLPSTFTATTILRSN